MEILKIIKWHFSAVRIGVEKMIVGDIFFCQRGSISHLGTAAAKAAA